MGPIAQPVEQRTFNPRVLGSNPNVPIYQYKSINFCLFRLAVRTVPFHGENTGSIPVRDIYMFFSSVISNCTSLRHACFYLNVKRLPPKRYIHNGKTLLLNFSMTRRGSILAPLIMKTEKKLQVRFYVKETTLLFNC